jgi:hypothetical protein
MRNVKRAAWAFFCGIIFLTGGCVTSPTHLKAAGQIPIMAYGGVPQAEANVSRFGELADAGITLSYSGFSDVQHARDALDAAQKAGVRIVVSLAVLQSDPAGTADALKDHPALAGYILRDEPSAPMFPELAAWKRKLQQADPKHYSYINLFPTYAGVMVGTPTYQEYLDKFVKTVEPAFISFDSYPVVQDGKQYAVRGDWYENLERVSATAKKAGIPFWAFALSTHHFSYPTPTLAHLRLQMFTNLAYGARTLEYFTYWQSSDPMFANAPIDLKGNRTAIYDTVKQMNAEVQGLAPVFLGSQVVSVGHIGTLPAGTHRYEPQHPIESVTAGGSGAIVSTIRRDNRCFLVIVNRDVNLPQTITVQWNHAGISGPMARVEKDSSLHRLEGTAWRETLDPGDIAVLSWTGRGN